MHVRRKQLIILSFVILASLLVFRTYVKELDELWSSTTKQYRPSYYETTEHVHISDLDGDREKEGMQLQVEADVNLGSGALPTRKGNVLQHESTSVLAPLDTSNTANEQVTLTAVTSTYSPTQAFDRIVVMGKTQEQDTTWVQKELPEWANAIYVVDNQSVAGLHTQINKGRESLPYLTYLVDNYADLPSTIVFLHSHRSGYPEAWHNEGGSDHSAVQILRDLNINFIQQNGYANLRCVHDPGCPGEVQPFRNPPEAHRTIEAAMPDAWLRLFGNSEVPRTIATPCCAQFAVSRDQVLKRPLSEYKKYLDWLITTPLDDDTSGRVFEYLWHIIFGQEPVYCPAHGKCYCDVYGQCR